MPQLACRGFGLSADTSTGISSARERWRTHYDLSVVDSPRPGPKPSRMVRPRKISLRERLAVNVRNERLARRWTQEDLEHRSGVSQRYISRLESAKSAISVDTIEKLADAFAIDGELLLRRVRKE